MVYIDKYAYFNDLRNVHPIEKFCFAISTLIIVLASNSITISISAFLLTSFLVLFKAKIPLKFYFKLLLLPGYFLIVGVLSVAINVIPTGQAAIFSVNIFHVNIGMTHAGLNNALRLFFKAFGCVSCMYFLTLTVPMVEIINILGKLKVPKLFLELMAIIYRTIFVMLDTFDRIHTSQSSRLGYRNIRISFRSIGKLAAALFVISFKRSNDMYNALESRCFTGEFNFLQKKHPVSAANIVFIMIIDSALIIAGILFRGKI
jgi:cobalt/nickel transport system permease protein